MKKTVFKKLNQSTREKAMRRAFKIWLGVIKAPECLEDMENFKLPDVDILDLRMDASDDGRTLYDMSDVCDFLAEMDVYCDWYTFPRSVRRIMNDMQQWASDNMDDLENGNASDAVADEERRHCTLSAILWDAVPRYKKEKEYKK